MRGGEEGGVCEGEGRGRVCVCMCECEGKCELLNKGHFGTSHFVFCNNVLQWNLASLGPDGEVWI